ncbi:MAG TPA: hypothetical protein DCE42_03815 [Myxococcales bacterium]|nr:hypothetical protein [Deltaproteobacteria bacterium]HAA53852.1 hypothetical protein [Myxococcales bacterium]|tara:strand:+ start:2042 stop:3265 length:1224 start_codon:yes stop_codon:yes gene_type:complete
MSGVWKWATIALVTVGILIASVAGMRLMASMKKLPSRKERPTMAIQVETQTVHLKTKLLTLRGFGTTQAAKSVEVVPETSGRVVYVAPTFREGGRVQKGKLLFQVDSRLARLEVKRLKKQSTFLQKQLSVLKQALALDRRNVSRNKMLVKRRALDRGSFERYQINLFDRKQRLENMKQSLAINEVQLENARVKLRQTRVYAPFDARVTKGGVERGGFVAQGKSVATLESRDAIEFSVNFPLHELEKMTNKDGQHVDIEDIPKHLMSLPSVEIWRPGNTSMSWRGRVIRVGAKVDLSTRTLPLWIRIPLARKKRAKRSSRSLLPGVFVKVKIPVQRLGTAVKIPTRALYGEDVFVVVDGKLVRRRVSVTQRGTQYSVVTAGLREGDVLVSDSMIDPIEGTAVRISTQQ